jgi:1,4-dihydroxy-6-naphthoate synthase
VEELNRKAFSETFHITKLSFFAWMKLQDKYDLLDSGSALGHGCGPLLISRTGEPPANEAKIAIPGEYTTAHLLLKLFDPKLTNVSVARFDHILEGVSDGTYDAGLVIHESRFVYEEHGLKKVVDLGQWWEDETGAPIPLGCIAISKKPCAHEKKSEVESVLGASVRFALNTPTASRDFVKEHARELDDHVIDSHIGLYVNDFTVSLGEKGRKAVEKLEEMARCREIL